MLSVDVVKFREIIEFGANREELAERESLRKRIRIVNILSVLCAGIGFFSLPFDFFTAPRWMLVEDVLSVVVFLAVPFLNRAGMHRLSRIVFLLFGNLIFVWNVAEMGPAAGIHLVFFPLAGFGAMLFEAREIVPLVVSLAVPITAYFLAVADLGTGPDHAYFLYASVANFLLICAGFFFLQRTGDRAEAELRRSQKAMILSEKMAALGEMSSGVAHEINTPLVAIRLNAELLRRHVASGEDRGAEIRSALANIDRVVARITKITSALQSFSRSAEKDPPVSASVKAIVDDAIELCGERFKDAEVELRVDPIPADAFVECRPVQITQVVLNLLNNAFAAIANRPERWIRLRVTSEGPRVRIVVADSGNGVATEIQDKIFQPFFTTKGPGLGTGLGLSISKGIVEDHSGRIYLAKESANTEFVVDLPLRK